MNEEMPFTEYHDPSSFFKCALQVYLAVNYLDIPLILHFIIVFVLYYTFFRYRNSIVRLSLLFTLSMICVCLTEAVNEFLFENWKEFHFSRNYFDAECVFTYLFWTLPHSLLTLSIIFGLFVDFCKSIAVHKFFNTILRDNPDTYKPNSK